MTNTKAIAIALGVSLTLVSRTDARQPSLQMLLEPPQMPRALEARSQPVLSTEPTSEMAWSNVDHVDPGAATVIALVPGFFVHGLGHFYARDPVRGVILLGAQAGSVLWFFSETFVGMIEGDKEGSATGQIAAVSLYFGTWFYDFVHAGKAAENYNAKLHITLRQQHESTFLCAAVSF